MSRKGKYLEVKHTVVCTGWVEYKNVTAHWYRTLVWFGFWWCVVLLLVVVMVMWWFVFLKQECYVVQANLELAFHGGFKL